MLFVYVFSVEWFGFYVDGQDTNTQTLQQSQLYTEDWLGLQQLDKQGKLSELLISVHVHVHVWVCLFGYLYAHFCVLCCVLCV